MTSIHIQIPSNNGKWHTRHYTHSEVYEGRSFIMCFDKLLTNLRNTRGWKVKVGYNLLRECV
jgi:hypothetical protein